MDRGEEINAQLRWRIIFTEEALRERISYLQNFLDQYDGFGSPGDIYEKMLGIEAMKNELYLLKKCVKT